MKTKYLLFGIIALGLLSCDKILGDGTIWDINPVVVTVVVTDVNGVDLLNPDNQNSLDTSGIKAFYNGKEYECNKLSAPEVATKAYLPHFYGLKIDKNRIYSTYFLSFGELDGAKSYSNEEVTIFWGDGSSDKIKFNRKFRWKLNGDPKSSEEWFLNGKKVPDKLIKIVK
ncbi:MAG: hypothetical protein WCR61_05650 [Bacteroidales bacterium]|nr:hypothetical protein [Bacteroidales bacterium]